ncbi:hypothetical protein PtA15_5A614 [Puccinia triticina]|uniref:C2H2-type domain-containing protein n=1 Tax=Puccinia triticina TaxID=208348 RepID=A0ABY7CMK4_9BASI|nr:uncharacterized protein PtA15_5A614 [Puccinia triticina]WAQ85040.1 hypothetical protein PtA15_5A614 [Puccinia triticina]WAR58375.1 hypothetical protein PtB15_5B609 [Puccinia triticina]
MSGFECAPCGRQFRLYQHYQDHMIHSSRHYYCAPCRRDFESRDALDSHLSQPDEHMICEWCRILVGKLRHHNQRHHEKCLECNQWYEDANDIHRHRSLAHTEVYCVPCQKLFGNSKELTMHLTSYAHQPLNVECDHPSCGQQFISKVALVQHLETGTCQSGVNLEEVGHYFSRHCDRGQQFVRRGLIFPAALEEIICDKNGYYPCHICLESFLHKRELVSHLKSLQHTDHGHKAYKCPSARCGRAGFDSLSDLMIHLDNGDCGITHARELYTMVDELTKVLECL